MRGNQPLMWSLLMPGLAACGGTTQQAPTPTSFEVTMSEDEAESPWAACLKRVTGSGDLESDVSKLGRACGARAGQRPIGPARQGQQAGPGAVDRYTFHAQAGSCVRAYVVGDAAIKELSVELVDEMGDVVATSDPLGGVAAAPHRAPLCLKDEGVYTVEVAITQGAGSYALQVWTHAEAGR